MTVGKSETHVGSRAVEHLLGVGDRACLEDLRIDDCHGAGQVLLLDRTVTDHDSILENVVRGKGNADGRATVDGHLLILVSHERENESLAGAHLDLILAVEIGDGTFRSAFHQDSCTRKRGSLVVVDDTLDGDRLTNRTLAGLSVGRACECAHTQGATKQHHRHAEAGHELVLIHNITFLVNKMVIWFDSSLRR